MSLDIRVEKKANYAYTVVLEGSIDVDTQEQLEEELKEIINENTRAIILDMAGVDYISSIGIRVVFWAKKELHKKNASFAMTNLQPQIKKVFEIMRILPMIDIFDDMPEADKYIDQIIKDETKKTKSMKGVISFVDVDEDWESLYLKDRLADTAAIKHFSETADLVLEQIKDSTVLSAFIKSKIDKNIIDSLPQLKLITTRSTGFDHIDTEYARAKGIVVSNVPTYGDNTVAEHTFALILSIARNLKKAHFRVSEGDFSIKDLIGFDLKGKTIGVVGTGHIGLRVIKMAAGFSMNALAFDPVHNNFLEEVLGFKYVNFETLLRESDIITLHAPYSKKTHHLINQDNIKWLKKGAILINTARGGLIDTLALTKALDEGIIAGAGLDVLEGEDIILEEKHLLMRKKKELYNPEKLQLTLRNGFLLQRDNVIFTPHTAFYSKEALMRILDTTVKNISDFMKGNPVNVVT